MIGGRWGEGRGWVMGPDVSSPSHTLHSQTPLHLITSSHTPYAHSFVFQISVSLTDLGEQQLSSVLDLVFAAVALTRSVPPSDDKVRKLYNTFARHDTEKKYTIQYNTLHYTILYTIQQKILHFTLHYTISLLFQTFTLLHPPPNPTLGTRDLRGPGPARCSQPTPLPLTLP